MNTDDFLGGLIKIYRRLLPEKIRLIIRPFGLRVWRYVQRFFLNTTRAFVIDFHAVDHCNLNCAHCLHFSPLAPETFVDPADYEKDCIQLSKILKKIRVMNIMGGEPLLHPRLAEFIYITRKYFKSAKISILTNGLLLLKQNEEFWKSCAKNNAQILVSYYPVNLNYSEIENTAKKYNARIIFAERDRQYMTKFPLSVEAVSTAKKNHGKCPYAYSWSVPLKDGKLFPCFTSAYSGFFNDYFKKNMDITEEDYLDIYKVKTRSEVIKFLNKPIPFCKYCNTSKIVQGLTWERSKFEISEWTVN
ncbi:hypothetical protein AGMMS50212_14440 [Spirochaetia bacterium]|nr:hypothetical protein AGMMS50212_14440 [Spirochaetia bacterium]